MDEFLLKGQDYKKNGIEKFDVKALSSCQDWLLFDSHYIEQIKIRNQYYEKYPHIICQGSEVIREEVSELYEYLIQYMKSKGKFELTTRGFLNTLTKKSFNYETITSNQLRDICLNFCEDFLILKKEEEYRLKGGILCFPSGWSLKEKMGMNIIEIHSPVPFMNENIGKKITHFLDSFSSDTKFWRMNFLTTNSDKLTCLKEIKGEDNFRSNKLRELYIRNERECFFKLPKTGAIVFSIKTYLNKASSLERNLRESVASFIEALPVGFESQYRNLNDAEVHSIIQYLRSVD